MREPLLHFVLLGGIVFGLDALIAGRQDDPRVIVIDGAVDASAIDIFRKARGREPTQDELYGLRRVWLDNEVLYREGIALGMDRGDKFIQDRVIFKALSMVNAGLKLPDVDDATLRKWFESNRARYDEPARYDFQEAVLAGEPGEAAAREFAAALQGGLPGDAKAGLRVFKDRPHDTVVQSYGADFARGLAALAPGQWSVLPQGDAWRVVRLDVAKAARPGSFEDLRGVALQDWKDAVLADQRTAAVRAMAQKYTVRVQSSAEAGAP